ncbi:hypothetical protein GW17_00056972 [Ensete ventricosum]|nr:hypothetical protein GW17_00056972 [Ensete ventricosum]
MQSASVLFIMDEMRKRSATEGHATTGQGCQWGVLFGFGPGLTVETVVLHSVPIYLHAMRKSQRARGPATIMAIGTANPPNLYEQSTYPDYYFRVTNSEHMQELKHKFRRICKRPALFYIFL